LGQIVDQIFGQVLGLILDQILTRFWTSRVSRPEKTVYSFTGTEKGYRLTSIVFLGPTQQKQVTR